MREVSIVGMREVLYTIITDKVNIIQYLNLHHDQSKIAEALEL